MTHLLMLTLTMQLVQARMWAQGLTVGTLLGSALLAGASATGNKVVEGRKDHSWADLLGTSLSSPFQNTVIQSRYLWLMSRPLHIKSV